MQWNCNDWDAWYQRGRSGSGALLVTGSCVFPTAGYQVELRPHEPQGFNPFDLLLQMLVTPPKSPQPEGPTRVSVSFEMDTDLKYQSVTVIDVISIPVRLVT